ncbi:MAG: hypothetical protein AAF399_19270, partial [Bacteroidota bacterium]
MIRTYVVIAFGLFPLILFAQPDTLLRFDFQARITDTLITPPPTNLPQEAWTSAFKGSMQTTTILPTQPGNLVYANTELSRLEKAAERFSLDEYPGRLSVKILAFSGNDTIEESSGLLVGDRWVLTNAFAFWDVINEQFYDSIQVFPAFDQGVPHPIYGMARVKKGYAFLTLLQNQRHDPGLLELVEPIGNELGYAGIYMSQDSAFFTEQIFHKLSYVQQAFPGDSLFAYSNDTLYYNYGRLDILPAVAFSEWHGDLGIASPGIATGLEGQLGSPFFFQDSSQTEHIFAVGVFTYAAFYRHYRITPEVFAAFSPLIGGPILSAQPSLGGEVAIK